MLRQISCIINILLITVQIGNSQSGKLDTSFGSDGEVKFDLRRILNADDYGGEVQIDQQGRIYIFGVTKVSNESYYCIFRLEKDGEIDSSFQDNGKLLISGRTTFENMKQTSFIIDSSGNLYLAGKFDR